MSDANLSSILFAKEESFAAALKSRASGTITFSGLPLQGETVTVGTKVYTFRSLVGSLDADGDVLIGATAAATATNLINAINADPLYAGVTHSSLMTANDRAVAKTGGAGIVSVLSMFLGLEGLAQAATTLVSDGVVVTNNDTLTIDGKIYTFKNVLTPAEGEILIAGSAAATLVNIMSAILHSGTPGVDYSCAGAHPSVTVLNAPTPTNLVITAISAGTAGNAITISEGSTHLSIPAGANLVGGTDDTVALSEAASNCVVSGATLTGGSGNQRALTELRFTSDGLVPGKDTVQSQEIRSDRSVRELVQVGVNSRGALNVELHAQGLDDFIIAALLANAFTEESSDSAEVAGDLNDQTLTNAGGPWSSIVQGARYIKLSGFATSGNNGIKKIVSVVDEVITLAPGSLVSSETADPCTYSVRYARNGVFLTTFLLVKELLSFYPRNSIACRGQFLNKFDLKLEPKSIAQVSLDFGGALQETSIGAMGPREATGAPNTPAMNTSSNIGAIQYDGSETNSPIMSLNLSINNNLRDRNALSRLYTLTPGKGTLELTGLLTAYFETRALFDDFLAHASRAIEFPVIDSLGNLINFYLPKVSFATAQAVVEGINTDLMIPLGFQAVQGAGGYMIQVDALNA